MTSQERLMFYSRHVVSPVSSKSYEPRIIQQHDVLVCQLQQQRLQLSPVRTSQLETCLCSAAVSIMLCELSFEIICEEPRRHQGTGAAVTVVGAERSRQTPNVKFRRDSLHRKESSDVHLIQIRRAVFEGGGGQTPKGCHASQSWQTLLLTSACGYRRLN